MIFDKYNGTEQFYEMDNAYTKVAAKAFLSCKSIHEIILSDRVTEIGNWAFAHMHNLERIGVPSNEITIGKDTFLDCPKLREIHIYNEKIAIKGSAELMASAVTILEQTALFVPAAFSDEKRCAEWFQAYDEVLVRFLNTDDSAMFEPVLIGWFDDEGEDAQLPKYLETVRMKKAKLVFLRLKYDHALEEDTRKVLYTYIERHMPTGEPEHLGVWNLLGTEYGKDIENIKILQSAGVLKNDLILKLIDHLNKKDADAEVLAFLLSIEQANESNILDEMTL